LVLMLAGGIPLASAHEEDTLDPHNATPGVRLTLLPLPASVEPPVPRYRLQVIGLPAGTVVDVWVQEFGRPFQLVASGLWTDAAGAVVKDEITEGGPSNRASSLVLEAGQSPLATVWMVALVSSDRLVRAFAATIPHPIIARSGPCKLQLELISYQGDRFVATGAGFQPGEDVTIDMAVAGRISQRQRRVLADGRLAPDVISHLPDDAERTARYAVAAKSCQVAIDYQWGKAALEPLR
jgi:hypothetical protein